MAGRPKGTPRTGGRKAGTPNKATADIKAAASLHGPSMIIVLAEIAKDDEHPPAARVAAAVALLDRGFGKPAQAITGEGGGPLQSVSMTLNEFQRVAAEVASKT